MDATQEVKRAGFVEVGERVQIGGHWRTVSETGVAGNASIDPRLRAWWRLAPHTEIAPAQEADDGNG